MEKNNIKRVRNILDGKYTDKVNVSVGYKNVQEEHVEGDIWEEEGKTWIIKNGIKQTVTKLDSVRKDVYIPLTCPQCGNVMRKRLDKKFWNISKKCFDCVIEEDNERIKKASFKEYEKQIIVDNMKAFLEHVKEFAHDYIESSDAKHYVTEAGDIEDWANAYTKDELKEIFDKQIEDFKKHIEEEQD